MIELSKTQVEDLDTLFQYQRDKEACWMAAFNSANADDKAAYMTKWTAHVLNPEIRMQTIRLHDEIVGSVARFEMFGERHVAYSVARQHWGKGIASSALQLFLKEEEPAPLVARVAFDNYGSQKVLQKCGFRETGRDRGFADARGEEIEEIIYQLG